MIRRLGVRRSPIHGKGVYALVDIPAHTVLIEYRGRLLTHAAADRRYAGSAASGHTFLFTLNERYVVDANVGGNSARWINHSCAPNCRAWIEEVDGARRDRVWIETRRAVPAGAELTYDYGIVLDQPCTAALRRSWACHCGAAHCRGTILKPRPRR